MTGAGGMLGADVARAGERAGHELVLVARAKLDIVDAVAVERAVRDSGADAVVNCAAWTDVDGAETERQAAYAVNALGASNLARATAAAGVQLVHISTDYVFSGEPPLDRDGRPRPYVESDPTGPRSVYGQTKLEGERHVLEASPRHTVARSSWLFGLGGRNFVDTMLRLAGEREATGPSPTDRPTNPIAPSVQVVDDQVGCPTWTGHLAPALLGLIERDVRGLVHLAGASHVSWSGFAKEIFRQAQASCRVEPVTTAEMARPAPRPAWSALESQREDVIPMPDWRDGLAGYLAARNGMMRA
ncbi:MAG TPA: dTDP-4-dehydrorhamnose reductase [Solirubrobacteraceae bacterium]|nr:dTDP-4-dehydrorhamnose reductase [Solirubrobacteraceae bacterium]